MISLRRASLHTALPWSYLALGLVQAAHSIEEVITGLWKWMPVVSGYWHGKIALIPVFAPSAQTFMIANIMIIAAILGFSPLPFIQRTWAWTIAIVVASIETLNGILHLSGAIISRGYFSGCVSGAILIIIGMMIWVPVFWGRKRHV